MDRLSPLAAPSATREVLQAHGLDTKKALGQHFLVNDAIIRKICDLAELDAVDTVLEVGPGIGTLTLALLAKSKQVVAVERDADLPPVLAETCAAYTDSFHLIQKDALQLTQADLDACGCGSATKFVSNLPYAVAATLVLDFFQRFECLESATVMVQSEVADRMAAKPGTKNYGAYTVKLSLYAEPAGRFQVGPGNFFPPPRVESAVLRLNRTAFGGAEELRLATCRMADASFAARRKTIANSCKMSFSATGDSAAVDAIPQILAQAGIDPKRRGETLERAEFIDLGRAYQDILGR